MTPYGTFTTGHGSLNRNGQSILEKIFAPVTKFVMLFTGRRSSKVRKFTKDEIKRILECRDSRLYGNGNAQYSRFTTGKR